MSQLQDNLLLIKSQKDNYLLPGNLKSGVTCLGVTGILTELKGETKTITPTTSQQTITPSSGKNGITQATIEAVTNSIDANITSGNIKKDVTILGVTGTYEGSSSINNQNKTVTPTTSQQSITADSGYTGLGTVTVDAVTSAIDQNITSGNIKNGVTILGVNGTFTGIDTSDADATASDIATGKTAYVNGQKITGSVLVISNAGTYTSSEKGVSSYSSQNNTLNVYIANDAIPFLIRVGGRMYANLPGNDIASAIGLTANKIKNGETILGVTGNYDGTVDLSTGIKFANSQFTSLPSSIANANWSSVTDGTYMFNSCNQLTSMPLIDTSNITNATNMFSSCSQLTTIPLLDLSSNQNMLFMFMYCTRLASIPQLNTSNVTTMNSTFANCTSLETVPILNTSSVTSMNNTFAQCPNLSNTSLNNILAMCINSNITSNKTLQKIGLSSTQADICETLSNWSDFETAGWSKGY